MQKILFSIILGVCSPLISLCQTQDTVYYDKGWRKTEKIKAEYYTIPVSTPKGALYHVKDYYITGQVQSEYAKTYWKHLDEGACFYYYRDGNNKSICSYHKGKKNGLEINWYKNGQIKSQGPYRHCLKDGKWQYFYKNGKKNAEEEYTRGRLLNSKYWTQDGDLLQDKSKANILPQYPKGEENLKKLILKNFKYPYVNYSGSASRKAIVSFIINQVGEMKDVCILDHPHPILEQEILRVMDVITKKWSPAVNQYRIDEACVEIAIEVKNEELEIREISIY